MVASLLKLRLLVLRNTLKRSTWQLVAVIIGGLYGLGLLAGVVIGLFALSFAPLPIARTVLVLAGSATLLGWILIPLFTTGIDQTLDIPKLAHFPIPRRTLMVGLAVIVAVRSSRCTPRCALLAALGGNLVRNAIHRGRREREQPSRSRHRHGG